MQWLQRLLRSWFVSCWLWSAAAEGADAVPEPELHYPPATAYAQAYADAIALKAAGKVPAHYRWLSAYHAWTQADLDEAFKLSSLQTNRLNFVGREIVKPIALAGGRLLRVNICALHIDARAWELLGELGSGPVPTPEPYFHRTVEVAQFMERAVPGSLHYVGGSAQWAWERYESGKKKVTAVANVDPQFADALFEMTGSRFPIFRWDWFCVYSMHAPAYTRFQRDPKDFNDILKLAGVDNPKYFNDRAVALRGMPLKSEVALHNRFVERVPSKHNYGRGYFYTSFDYLSSIGVNDLLKNVTRRERDAGEHIWGMPNGLQGYGLTAANDKIADKADPEVAQDKRTKRQSVIVRHPSCQHCHASGAIPVADQVRLAGRKELELIAPDLVGDGKRAEQIYDQYFGEEVNNLFATDNAHYAVAVEACTGETAAAMSLRYEDMLTRYLDAPITVDQVAREMGYPKAAVASLIERAGRAGGLDHSFTLPLRGQFARRDQFELAFPQLQDLMLRSKKEK